MGKGKPRLICIIGVDGVGKTTHVKRLQTRMEDSGIRCKYTWFRFHHFLSLFVLIYGRLAGLTVYETRNGQRVGRHEFHKSRLASTLYPWLLFIDMLPMYLIKITIPRRLGYTIICDRFVYDTLVDLMVALKKPDIHKESLGGLYLGLLPENTMAILVDLDEKTIRKRREDLIIDSTLESRRELYNRLCNDLHIPTVINSGPVEDVHDEIMGYVWEAGNG